MSEIIRDTIISIAALPGNLLDYNEIPKIPDVDYTDYTGLQVDDNFFAISSDPANFIIADLGIRKPQSEIIANPLQDTDIYEQAQPRFLKTLFADDQEPGITGSPEIWDINQSNPNGASNPNKTPLTPFKSVPMRIIGDLSTPSDNFDAFDSTVNGSKFPVVRWIATKPEEFVHYENTEKYITTGGGTGSAWVWSRKLVIPEEYFPQNGGPRDNGYINIRNGVRARINTDITSGNAYSSTIINNTSWKTGSIELTLKPVKQNCTILSGGMNLRPQISKRAAFTGKDLGTVDGLGSGLQSGQFIQNEILINHEVGPLGETLINTSLQTLRNKYAVPVIVTPDSEQLYLTQISKLTKIFKVKLVNGKVVVEYQVPYSTNSKHVILESTTNIIDGKWHHVVINRPNADVEKYPGIKYGGKGRLEIWIDGVLEAATDEIPTADSIPTPQLLFNDNTSVAYQNTEYHKRYITLPGDYNSFAYGRPKEKQWVEDALREENYEGGFCDYVFRQSYPLSPAEVGLNKVYALHKTLGSKIKKVKKMTATATMVQPVVTSNKPKVLKLYWNSLLKDKEKCLDGLELDNTNYDVYTYSISHKNLINKSLTFNLDLNNISEERFYHKNVKTATSSSVFIFMPGASPSSNSYLDNYTPSAQIMDTDSNPMLNAFINAVPGGPYYIENLLYGGVDLLPGDRILLTNQKNREENGIWEFNGPSIALRRPADVDSATLKNSYVYVEQGTNAGKTFAQIEDVVHIRKDKQTWIEVDNQTSLSKVGSYPIHTTPYLDSIGNQRLINVNTDIPEDFDIIAFMNYPTSKNEILEVFDTELLSEIDSRYSQFVANLKTAVSSGKSLFVSSPMLAIDLGIVSGYENIDQLLNSTGDAQSAAISPFESGEPAESYFHTHRNMKYHLVNTLAGLTNKSTYIMTDFVTYSPDRTNSEYHIKYSNRSTGLQQGDEFYIPGLLTVPETINTNLPGYINNQRSLSKLVAFPSNKILLGTPITKFSNNYYVGSTATANPYHNYITTIAAQYGSGKIFVNCVENSYAMSRYDYNKGILQNVAIGQNAETTQTAAWQYSTKRLNKQNLYDFSEDTNLIGQTTPTNGGGGPIVQSQSHCSNGSIRLETNKNDLQFQSDLYPDFTEEVFATTEIPVSSMTWLGLQWLAG